MNYSCFLKEVTQRVREKVSDEHLVEVKSVRKNNGVMLDSMMIRRPEEKICPNIYLNQIYEEYLDGMTIDEAVERILSTYRMTRPALDFDMKSLFNEQVIRQQVVYRLINYSRNKALLEEVPHKRFLDLALIYYVMVHDEKLGKGAVMVRNDMLSCYPITLQELDEAALANTRSLLPADFLRITDLLREFGEKSGADSYADISLEEESEQSILYVLTNKSRQFGAFYMTDSEVLSGICEMLDTDLYVLPSSVHECMVVPADQWSDTESLACMVRDINHSQVSEDEYLADTVYLFRRTENRLTIAA